jgi:hypothetical protein
MLARRITFPANINTPSIHPYSISRPAGVHAGRVMLNPQHSSYTAHFLTGFSAQVAVFLVEGGRSDKAWSPNPLLIGLVYQILGAGWITPLSLLIVILACLLKPKAYLLPSSLATFSHSSECFSCLVRK